MFTSTDFPAPREVNGLLGYLWEYGYSLVATFLLSIIVFFQKGFDVIHAHNPPDLFVLIAILYRPLGIRFVFDHHDLAPEMYLARLPAGGSRIVVRALLMFERLTFWLADHVISTNDSYREIASGRGKVSKQRITVVRNGPDLKLMSPAPPDESLRKNASTILGYVGVIGFQDGVDYLVRALAHLATDFEHDDFYCWVLGDGHALDDVKALTKELGMQTRIGFTGSVSQTEVVRYLSAADICVTPDPHNPYTDRSTMVKMTEYMALAKPIVAFDLTEHRATAKGAALYARPNSERDFAEQIFRLINDPSLRQRLGAEGRRRVEDQLAWHHQIVRLLEVYASLGGIEHRPPPALDADSQSKTTDPVYVD